MDEASLSYLILDMLFISNPFDMPMRKWVPPKSATNFFNWLLSYVGITVHKALAGV